MKIEAEVINFPTKTKLVCSSCGAPGEGSCRCGAPYITPGERAEAAVKASPEKSNRVIAEEIGIDESTVRAARKKSTAEFPAVEKRVGKDGRTRAMPTRAERAPKAVEKEARVAPLMEWKTTKEIAAELGVGERYAAVTIDKARIKQEARDELLAELKVDPATFAMSAQSKLNVAIRQYQRKLDIEHAVRMRTAEEEIRQRIVVQGKEYIADMEKMRAEAYADQKFWREAVNDHKPPLTVDQFNLLRKCLHQNGIAATKQDFDAAFDLIQTKKVKLAGLK